jgi:peptide/nickel transport system ATP-binding protein
VVGESGCGKSTLAKVMVGLQRPTQGTVRYDGESLWDMTATQRAQRFGRKVGMVFQDPTTALNRRLSIARIIRDPLDVHQEGTPAQRNERVSELMSLVGLPDSVADAVPGQLSGGQRQRVAIARALVGRPNVLLADEPTGNLDSKTAREIMGVFSDLHREGMTIIVVTHDAAIAAYCHRVIRLHDGRIVEDRERAVVA